jgi:predicted MFS family arabinose efflux permease
VPGVSGPPCTVMSAASPTGWRVVIAAFFGVMVSFGSLLVFTFGVFVKPLAAEFGWSREAISAAFGFAAMTVAVCSPALGYLLDRYGPRRVILPCMLVFGAAIASLGLLTPSLVHLYATFVVLGAVGNGTTQMGYSRAVSTWFDARRGLALALVMAGVGVGAMGLPPLAQALISSQGWRTAYFALGALVLLFGIPLTALFVHERPHEATAATPVRPGMTTAEGIRTRAFWIIVAMLFLGSIAVNGAITHLSPLLTDRGVPVAKAALAASVLGGASFFGRLMTGYLLDRFFGPIVAAVLLAGVAAGILLLSTSSTALPVLTASALIGLGLGGEADITPYLLTRYFGLRSFSSLYGWTWTAYAIAGAIGPVLMGRAFDATGSYASLLTWLAGVTLIAALLMLALPAYPEKMSDDIF